MNNVIKLMTNGEIENNGRKFTKVYGGFRENQPIVTDKQVAELLGYAKGARQVRETLERNKTSFTFGTHVLDLKINVAENDNNYTLLNSLGYSNVAIGKASNIYIFSESGFLLFLKFAEGEKAIQIYKNFIEDYFKTKAENETYKTTLEDDKEKFIEQRKYILGSLIFESDSNKKMELLQRDKELEDKIKDIDETLTKKKLYTQLEDKLLISDRFTNGKNCYDIGSFAKQINIKNFGRNKLFEWMRSKSILRYNNEPYQQYVDYFKVIYINKNGYENSKTLLTGKGIGYIIKRLIKDGKISYSYDEAMGKLDNLKEENKIA